MFRRLFLQLMVGLALLAPLSVQAAGGKVAYSPEAVSAALAQGRAVLLEFSAEW
jgi:hypothetical protein